MRLLGRERIVEFLERHQDAAPSLRSWTQVIERHAFRHFQELRSVLGSADYVKPNIVFNIAGNKYRLIALIDYRLSTVVVEHVLTHAEYDRGKWRT